MTQLCLHTHTLQDIKMVVNMPSEHKTMILNPCSDVCEHMKKSSITGLSSVRSVDKKENEGC